LRGQPIGEASRQLTDNTVRLFRLPLMI
jgi:hypothetical protein